MGEFFQTPREEQLNKEIVLWNLDALTLLLRKKVNKVMPGKINEHSFAESCFEGLPKSLRFSSYSYVLSSYDLA